MSLAMLDNPSDVSGANAPKRNYELPLEFFQKSLNEGILDSFSMDLSFSEKHDVRLKPDFQTACWSYLPPHNVFVGTEIFEKSCVKPNLVEHEQKKYIKNHYFHELAHALWTFRDLVALNQKLTAVGVAFSLMNLFEDARIEHKFRLRSHYQFEWLKFEELTLRNDASSFFFGLVQSEGDYELVHDVAVATVPGFTVTLLERVYEYYLEAISAKNTLLLIPLLKRWMAEFPNSSRSAGGSQDLPLGAKLQSSSAALQQFLQGTKNLDGDAGPSKDSEKVEISSVQESKNLLGNCSGKARIDMRRSEAIARKFEKFFVSKSRYVTTDVPQKRISMKSVFAGKAPYRKPELSARKTKNLFVVFDLSGSMQGAPLEEGKVLLAALSLLAQQRKVVGHVAFSAVTGGISHYQVFKLPLAFEVIQKIDAFGQAEGLDAALRNTVALAKAADYTLVYTDANICDAPVDKSWTRKNGIETWGLYVGESSPEILSSMMDYFMKALVRKSTEELVDAILLQLK